ncbi:MAG TPA: hypothetical protein VD978_28675 [Azospirillum sp.]|nr:hypothetical protein [Azospirillum sp.]
MLVTLSLVFCLAADPTQCHTVKPMIPDNHVLTLAGCQITGQIEGAKWLSDHPHYQLARVHCSIGDKASEDST